MAAPKQKGFLYYNVEVNYQKDPKFLRAEELADPGMRDPLLRVILRAVVPELWSIIYGREGYFMMWTEELAINLARDYATDSGTLTRIIEAMVKAELFDAKIYQQYRILTSHGIQLRWSDVSVQLKRYLPAKGRYVSYIPELILLSEDELFAKKERGAPKKKKPENSGSNLPPGLTPINVGNNYSNGATGENSVSGYNAGSIRIETGNNPEKNSKTVEKTGNVRQRQFKKGIRVYREGYKGKDPRYEAPLQTLYDKKVLSFLPSLLSPDATRVLSAINSITIRTYPPLLPILTDKIPESTTLYPDRSGVISGYNNNPATNDKKPTGKKAGRPPRSAAALPPDMAPHNPAENLQLYLSEPMAGTRAKHLEMLQKKFPAAGITEDMLIAWTSPFQEFNEMRGLLQPRPITKWTEHFFRWLRTEFDPTRDPNTHNDKPKYQDDGQNTGAARHAANPTIRSSGPGAAATFQGYPAAELAKLFGNSAGMPGVPPTTTPPAPNPGGQAG